MNVYVLHPNSEKTKRKRRRESNHVAPGGMKMSTAGTFVFDGIFLGKLNSQVTLFSLPFRERTRLSFLLFLCFFLPQTPHPPPRIICCYDGFCFISDFSLLFSCQLSAQMISLGFQLKRRNSQPVILVAGASNAIINEYLSLSGK